MSLLRVSKISKQGESDDVLKDISFTQKKLQHIAIAGETGSGKSTLLKIIAGLIQPDSGDVFFKNGKVEGPDEKLVPGHPCIAYLSQHFELPKFLKVEQVLSYASSIPEQEAENLYETCRISHLLSRKTDQLSGGERQRIALARLLGSQPGLLLLDEPFTNLDMEHRRDLKAVIDDVSNELKITCILVSHEPVDLLPWADKILVMKNGRIIQRGNPLQIYNEPIDTYVAGLFGKFNLIPLSETFHKLNAGKGQNMLVRPEHIKLVPESDGDIAGEVQGIRFMGSFFEADISVNKRLLMVRTSQPDVKIGDRVFLHILSERIRYVD